MAPLTARPQGLKRHSELAYVYALPVVVINARYPTSNARLIIVLFEAGLSTPESLYHAQRPPQPQVLDPS